MTQEQYDALWAKNCPECPFNETVHNVSKAIYGMNRCELKGYVHQIFTKKPRWCPYKGEDDATAKSENHETPGDPKE